MKSWSPTTPKSNRLGSHHASHAYPEVQPTQRPAPSPRSYRRPTPIRAILWRWKWVILSVICAVLIYSFLTALQHMHPDTRRVVLAARSIDAGSTISSADVTYADIPRNAVAEGSVNNLDDAIGQTVVAKLTRNTPIITDQLLQSTFSHTAPPGTVVTPVPLANTGVIDMLRVGNRVNLYAPSSDTDSQPEAQLVAENTLVLAIANKTTQATLLKEVNNTTTVFLAVPKSTANLVIGIGATTPLHAVLIESHS